jgi:uncharacterized OB-fold protein
MGAPEVNRPSGMLWPGPTAMDEPMWRAAAEGRLDVQRCTDCGAHRYPPVGGCYRCQSSEWHWDTVSGTGTIATYCWILDRVRTEDRGTEVYYNIALVTLEGTEGEPVRVVTNVVNAWNLEELEVGQRVELHCVKLSGEIGLPCFALPQRASSRE